MSAQTAGKFLYFAYGSNLLAHRIHMNNPSAKRAGVACLKDYQISFVTFSKRWQGASATIVPKKGKVVWGALWTIDNADMEHLDRQEGVHENIYRVLQVDVVTCDGTSLNARTYQQVATPKDVEPTELPQDCLPSVPYWKTITKGAEESRLPQEYINFLHQIPHNGYDGKIDLDINLSIQ